MSWNNVFASRQIIKLIIILEIQFTVTKFKWHHWIDKIMIMKGHIEWKAKSNEG